MVAHSQISTNSQGPRGKGSTATSSTSNNSGRNKSQSKVTDDSVFQYLDDDPPSPCKLCPDLVYGDGIQCDNCLAWVHCPGHKSNCCRLSKKEFAALKSSPDSVKWWCNVCQNENNGNDNSSMKTKLAEHSSILNDLRAIIKTMQQQNEIILDMLKNRNPPTEDSLKIHVEQALEGMLEKENRKNNIILYNVDESKKKGQECEKEDEVLVKEILNFVNPVLDSAPINIEIKRLGRPRDLTKQDTKPRPVKVSFDNVGIPLNLLRKAYRLKDFRLKKIGLSADKTKAQREAEKATRDEYRRRKANNEDVCMYRGKVLTKDERDKIRGDDYSDMPLLEGDEESQNGLNHSGGNHTPPGGSGHDGH